MKTILTALGLLVAAGLAFAQAASAPAAAASPVGLWKTVDDSTGKEKSLVRITDDKGVLTGRIEKLMNPDTPDPKCTECTDERKDRPITGMVIIRGAHQDAKDKEVWTGGDILDPAKGRVYTTRLKPVDGGRKLEVRGYIGVFFRTQTWVRAE